jgi:hypothetical protein
MSAYEEIDCLDTTHACALVDYSNYYAVHRVNIGMKLWPKPATIKLKYCEVSCDDAYSPRAPGSKPEC